MRLNRNICAMILSVCAVLILTSGCDKNRYRPGKDTFDNVLVIYMAGYNSLSNNLKENLKDIPAGYVPDQNSGKVLLVAQHLTNVGMDYRTPTEPRLIRYYKKKGKVHCDTLKTYAPTMFLTQVSTMSTILHDAQSQFKSDHYGLIFSSHATGWLPKGYYTHSSQYENTQDPDDIFFSGKKKAPAAFSSLPDGAVPHEELYRPGQLTRSLGQEVSDVDGSRADFELNLDEFAAAIPFKLDYLVLDCCLCGGVEVAYEFRKMCDRIMFSPAEELAHGLDLKSVGVHLLKLPEPDVVGLANAYFRYYFDQSEEQEQSATVTVVKTSELDALASFSKTLFSKYRNEINSLKPATVQRYYRDSYHWFYDFEDILIKAGMTSSERTQLEALLEKCLEYHACTDYFFKDYYPSASGIKFESCCGLSMFLPSNGGDYLKNYYKSLQWNIATGLVE